jgi:hypothetical protein
MQYGYASSVKFDRKQKKKLQEANIFLKLKDYYNAYDSYKELYPLDSLHPEINHGMGVCYLNFRGREDKALRHLESARKNGMVETSFYLGRAYHLAERFNDAINEYQYYRSHRKRKVSDEEVERHMQLALRAKEMAENPVDVTIENLGPNINSKYQEYVPLVTGDESKLYFTSRRPEGTGDKVDLNGEHYEDVYWSENDPSGWKKAQNAGPTVNSETHDATVGITPNGNTMLIYRTNQNISGGDLYLLNLNAAGEWDVPNKLGTTINSDHQEPSASLSSDERVMYFSSNRPGGMGGKDIYRVMKLPTGDWSLPLNLGPGINTPYDEDAPFIHTDGKTLYFSSQGHLGMGGYDVFKTTLGDSNIWSYPENLGYPINTVENDMFFTLNATGKTGYYSSAKDGGYGGHDIYKVNMLNNDAYLTVVKGIVVDDSTNAPLRAKITLFDDNTHQLQGIYNSNRSRGNYIVVVVPDRQYQAIVEVEGYQSIIEYITVTIEETEKDELVFKEIRVKRKK